MEPRIVEKPEINLVGMVFYGEPSSGEFAKTWDRFMQHEDELPRRSNTTDHYGLEFYTKDMEQTHKWFYMACVPVDNLEIIPIRMVAKRLPASTYAVYTVKGGLKNLGEGFRYVYDIWLPSSSYQVAHPFDFELYQEGRFKGDEQDSEIDIYIPVKLK
jgi:AraC family transcriptional regulator